MAAPMPPPMGMPHPGMGGPPPMGPPMGGMHPGMGGPPHPPVGPPAPPPPPTPMMEIVALRKPIEALISRLGKAISLLRRDIPRGYRIDIETDSTISGDAQEERADSVEFLSAVTKFMETAGMIGAQQPTMIPLLGKMLQFGVRKFRTGRDLESAIDDFCDQAERKAKAAAANPQAKPPSPDELKAKADAARMQAEITKSNIEAQAAEANDKRDRERMAMEHQAKLQQMQMEMQRSQQEHEMRLQEIQAAKIAKEIAHQQDTARAADPTTQNLEVIKAHSIAAKAQAEITKANIESQTAQNSHEMDQQRGQAEHEAKLHEMALDREMKLQEHQAKLTHLHHQRLGAREDHLFRTDQMDHERALLREKATGQKRDSEASPLIKKHAENIAKLGEVTKTIHQLMNTRHRVVRGDDGSITGLEPDVGEPMKEAG
jgi:hypothetical protein